MIKTLVPAIALFVLGFGIATIIYRSTPSDAIKSSLPTTFESPNGQSKSEDQDADAKTSHLDQEILQYQNILQDRDLEIIKLQTQIASLSKQNQLSDNDEINSDEKLSAESNQVKDPTLKKMSMKDFEESMKDSFVDRFKGIVLEISGEELDAMKKTFSETNERNEWSNRYEESIANFFADNDRDGEHFIQSINCNTKICRLEINTNNDATWNTLYASMTEEPWYKTITLEEDTGYPGNHVYYLPSIDN